ncbi:MAG TPA: N-acetylneuraminate synthase [Limnobacter sp.]|nr:N-acetylneuraminate synthase [Limnobacter sp.]
MVTQNRTFVIAEAGVNHNGKLDLAIELIDIAKACGADAVKFQTFSADDLVLKGAAKAEYQTRETGEGDQYEMLKSLELSEDAHRVLVRHCTQVGIEFMSTPFGEPELMLLKSLGMKILKIPSGELTNHPYVRFAARQSMPILLSTGMSDLEEVCQTVALIRDTHTMYCGRTPNLTVLHCTSNYPAAAEEANLKAMLTLQTTLDVEVGYSDHTLGVGVSTAAVALGAKVIEKHFTIDKGLKGPDHKASLEPAELKMLVEQIRQVEVALGDGTKRATASELKVRDVARRSIVLKHDVLAKHLLTEGDLVMRRPGVGLSPAELDKVIGKKTRANLSKGHLIGLEDVE